MRTFILFACLTVTACTAPSTSTRIYHARIAAQVTKVAPRKKKAPVLQSPEVVALAIPQRPVTLDGFALDLGVGEAPYDDGPKPIDPMRSGRAGFSDALIRVSYEHSIGNGAYLVGSASAFRVQDRQIFHALQDLDMSWAVIGVRISF